MQVVFLSSDRERIRTFDRRLRRAMLYPAELRDQNIFKCVGKSIKKIYSLNKYTKSFFKHKNYTCE